jgi:ATP-dependent helicase Lhr and Lhr-like helicase
VPGALHLAAQGAGRGHRAQPARAAGRHRQPRGARGDALPPAAIAVRTGDTPAAERERFQREPADILITTPESLYLLLTSNAREALRSIDTVIIDEIHALVRPNGARTWRSRWNGSKRLGGRPLQRIGLSATQRPLDEVARFLGARGRRRSAQALRPKKTRGSRRQ